MGRTGGTRIWALRGGDRQARQSLRTLGITWALLLVALSSAHSQDLNALFTSSTSIISSKSEDSTTDLQSFAQTLDLNWNKAISPVLRYRLTLRGEDSRNQIKVDSDVTRGSAMQVEPIFDATLSSSAFSLNGGFRLRELLTDGNKQDRILLSERRWFTRFFLTPLDLPTFSFQVDGATQQNDVKSIDQSDIRYQISTNYDYGGATFSYLFSDRVNEDFVAGQTRDQKSNTGTLGYTGTSLWGWLDVLAGYSINYSTIHEEFSKSGVVEVDRQLSRGFKAAADLTPNDSTDVPLTVEPALINGSALIPLEINTSVGFEELLPLAPISQIRLNLTPQPPFTIPNDLQLFVNFRVFFTDDLTLNSWTEVPGAVTFIYDSLESRARLNFAATTARFFKVYVSRNDFGALIQVTRITALNLEFVDAGTKRDQNTLANNVNGSFTVRPPMKPWTLSALSYDFSLSHLMQQPDAVRNISGTHTARIVAEPHRFLVSTFTYQHNFAESNQEGSKATTADLYSLVFSATPLPTLTSSLSIAHNDNRGDGKLETRSDSGSLNVSTRLYRNLNVDSTYSISRSEDFLTDQKTLSQGGTINANAILTQRLNATLGYSLRWSKTEQPEQQTEQLTHTINSSYTYTVSRFLNFNTRYDFLKGNDVISFSQDYRVDWTPTPKLSAFFGYRRTQQESNGEKSGSDSINVNGRWNISRHLNLDANFVFFKDLNGNTVHSFSARAQIRF